MTDSILDKVIEENRKLTSMCRAAAEEIEDHWEAHCNEEGYGPINLVSRLNGKLKPALYPAFDPRTEYLRKQLEK